MTIHPTQEYASGSGKTVDLGMHEIAQQSFDAMQETIARQKLAAYPPDIMIEIARNACGTLEFNAADHMIALGYTKAQQYLSHVDDRRMKRAFSGRMRRLEA